MRFASLGSGSEGNALVVPLPGATPRGATRFVLVDCGFAPRELRRRLQRLDLSIDGLRGVFVTHEHGDHVGGAFRAAALADCPVLLTTGTRMAVQHRAGFDAARCVTLRPDEPLDFEDLRVLPVPVPHDAREPVQFVIDDGRSRLGILTDIGCATEHVRAAMRDLTALVLECNHDRDLLAVSRYPESLKRRIRGDWGHLDNAAAAGILASLGRDRLRTIVAAHLSRDNNRPELARAALASAAGAHSDDIFVAGQDDGLAWMPD